MNGLLQDCRYALRMLVKAPGFALAAILTFALGIGANVALFSVVYGVLLRPLPYADGNRLIVPQAETEFIGTQRPWPILIRNDEVATWQQPLDAIGARAFYTSSAHALSHGADSSVLQSTVVSDTFFATLAGPFAAGRPLGPADDTSPTVVISERLAQRLFGAAGTALGREITLTSRPYTIVGVAARDFQFPRAEVDVWLPLGFERAASPRCCDFRVVARLTPEGTIARAKAAVTPRFRAAGTASRVAADRLQVTVVRLADAIVEPVRPALLVLFAAVLMVLLIASGNLINLLLARHTAREPEFAMRRALGASAGRLVRQLLVETALLAAIGAAGGLLIARVSLVLLAERVGEAMPRIYSIRLDTSVLIFAAAIATLATIATGLIPALRAARTSVMAVQAAGGAVTSRRTRRLQRTLCVAQVALALTLLVGATLLGRSLVRLLNVDLGVTTENVLTASVNLAFGSRPTDAQTRTRIDRLIASVEALPGVRAVGVGSSLPPGTSRIRINLRRPGESVDYSAAGVPATPGYFAALQARLIKGRFFTAADDEHRPRVMIMTANTARRFFGEGDPLGRTAKLPLLRDGKSVNTDVTLVGVIANVAYAGLGVPPEDAVYVPFAQQPWIAPFMVVRTTGDPAAFAATLRRTIATIDPGIVAADVVPLDRLVAEAAAQPRLRTLLLSSLALLALGMAIVGLYGVVAYAVAQRAKEIGIRVAIGATRGDVVGMVVRDGALVAFSGIAIGLAGAWAVSRLLAGLLYGVTPTDPASFVLAAGTLLAVALLASYLPARRAARIDPIRALRAQ